MSQTTIEPSTLIPNRKLRDAAKLIEVGKINEEKVKLYIEQNDFLKQRLSLKDSILYTYQVKDSINNEIIITYKKENNNLVQQKELLQQEVKSIGKALRRQKKKTIFITVATIASSATIYYFLKK